MHKTQNKMLPRLKPQYTEEMISEVRRILKDNTVDIYIVDMQAILIAFSLKRLLDYLEGGIRTDEEKEDMRVHIFKEATAVMMDLFTLYGEKPHKDTREWYDFASKEIIRADEECEWSPSEEMFRNYYERLDNGEDIRAMQLIEMVRPDFRL